MSQTAKIDVDWKKYDQDLFADYDDAVGFGGQGMIIVDDGIICEKGMEQDLRELVDKFIKRQDKLNDDQD